MGNFKLSIYSPYCRNVYDNVVKANFKAYEGEVTILANHIPVMGIIKKGNVKINDDIVVAVNDGVYYFDNNVLKIIQQQDFLNNEAKKNAKFVIDEKKVTFNYKNTKHTNLEISIKKVTVD